MLANIAVAALAFSAPQSQITRRDMMVGFGAGAAALISTPAAFAAKPLSSAEQKKATEEALKALDFKLDPAVKALQSPTFNPNAVNVAGGSRKSTDPNPKGGDKDAWMKKYGY